MLIVTYRTLPLVLVVLLFAVPIRAQQGFEEINPNGVRSTHLPGEYVEPPGPGEARLISNHGDTLILQYSVTIPSQKRALDRVSIYYRYTLGDDEACVIYRETSTRSSLYFSVGADDIVSLENLYKPNDQQADRDSFASIDVEALEKKHPLMRRSPTPLAHGALYQLAVDKAHNQPGPIYYVPREWRAYQMDRAVKLADKDFLDLGVRPYNNELIRSNDHYVVLINEERDKARVLDLATMEVHAFALNPPENSERWSRDSVLIDDSSLLVQHALYDLATGKRIAARDKHPGKKRIYRNPQYMHHGVCYGVTRDITYDDDQQRVENYRLWARPALDDGSQERMLVSNSTGLGFFPGEGGLVYTDGTKWTKTDWLNPEDFKKTESP